MRTHVVVACILILALASPGVVTGQRLATWSLPPHVALTLPIEHPSTASSESSGFDETHASTGAAIGGVSGAIVGAVAFAHFAHRQGSLNHTSDVVGAAFVGAGLMGAVGTLLGFAIGAAIPR